MLTVHIGVSVLLGRGGIAGALLAVAWGGVVGGEGLCGVSLMRASISLWSSCMPERRAFCGVSVHLGKSPFAG